jgi:ribonuclease Z
MDKLTVLGTGYAMATRCYNTCFILENAAGALLVDAGGGSGILRQMESAGKDWRVIRHMIITHAHCDHLLGAVWVLRKIGTMMQSGAYEGDFSVWCHSSVREALCAMAGATLQASVTRLIGGRIRFTDIGDGAAHNLLGCDAVFFDIRSTKLLQFGFTLTLPSGKKLACLGDEPFQPVCLPYIIGADWLLCEAFCLYAQRERFKPYEKNHSTVRDACELAKRLRIPHLVLWHTEDKNYDERQALYSREGREYYSGDLRVPYDLDVISLV